MVIFKEVIGGSAATASLGQGYGYGSQSSFFLSSVDWRVRTRYGIKRVILPERNLKDLVEVPVTVLSSLEVSSLIFTCMFNDTQPSDAASGLIFLMDARRPRDDSDPNDSR
ncbi:hypothetical protein BC332_07435 [Capsicum chinense]|nr:hypothetical protein BC332_07435 [Capsicum chinense]